MITISCAIPDETHEKFVKIQKDRNLRNKPDALEFMINATFEQQFPANEVLPPYYDLTLEMVAPYLHDYYPSGLYFTPEQFKRELVTLVQQTQGFDRASFIELHKKFMWIINDHFENGIKEIAYVFLEKYRIDNFNDDSITRNYLKTVDGKAKILDAFKQGLSRIDTLLNSERNTTVTKGEAWQDEHGNFTRNAKIQIGNSAPDYVTRPIWMREKERFQQLRKVLEIATEIVERELKELQNAQESQNEQQIRKRDEFISIVINGVKLKAEIIKQAEKINKTLQNKAVNPKHAQKYVESVNRFRDLEHQAMSFADNPKVRGLSQMPALEINLTDVYRKMQGVKT